MSGSRFPLYPEPFEPARELISRIIDLQNPAAGLQIRCFRSVQDWSGICPNITGIREAGKDTAPFYHPVIFAGRHAPCIVRAGSYQQRRIVGRYIVDVNPESHHPGQQFKRRRDVLHPPFYRPGAIVFSVDPLLYTNCSILMPCERPVCFRRLVKQDGPDRTASVAEKSCRNRSRRAIGTQNRSERGNAVNADASSLSREFVESGADIVECAQGGFREVLSSIIGEFQMGGGRSLLHSLF